jgi:hypothetical protein
MVMDGLSYVPDLGEQNSLQYYDELWINIAQQTRPEDYFSFKNRTVLANCMKALDLDKPTDAHKLILEIGIGRKDRLVNTSTFTLLGLKADSTRYIGIDAERKDYWKDFKPNIEIQLALAENALKDWEWDIHLLHIDGGHSVNAILMDWQFAQFVVPYGIIIIHDTKAHPGPIELVKAIDRNEYRVREYFENDPKDFGMAVVYRRGNNYDPFYS